MMQVLTATLVMTSIALGCAFVLAFAYRKLRVEEDPRLEVLVGMLPGNNCGACGQPGCSAFADALLQKKVTPGTCTVSSPSGVEAIANFLGVDAGAVDKRVARLHCAGGASDVRSLAAYKGAESCRAAVLVNAGGRGCRYGCLGLGDCERACTFHAIKMTPTGLPRVDVDKCTACNDCVEVCPLELFELQKLAEPLLVQCKTPLAGDAARALCSVACDACGRCVVDSPAGVMEMKSGLPIIKDAAHSSVAATFRCPTGAIQWVPGAQFNEQLVNLPSSRSHRG